MNHIKKFLVLPALAALLIWIPADTAGQARQSYPPEVKDQAERAQRAADVLKELTGIPEKGIPKELLRDANAIAVFPHVVKAAFGLGGRWGKGLISQRIDGQWSQPAYLNLTGGNFGFQAGAQAADLVLVFTSRSAVDSLLSSKLELNATAGATAGPVGRSATAGTDIKFSSGIFSYSRSKGLFAGVALDGAVITVDDSANRKVYGPNASARSILSGASPPVYPAAQPFLQALNTQVPPKPATAHQTARTQPPAQMARASVPANLTDQADRARRAGDIVQHFADMHETGIPRDLLERAYGIAVIPNVVQAALGLGGRWGKGLLTVRENDRWLSPVYIDLAGGSVGFQIGVQSADLVLVFTERRSVQSILESKLTLGGDASAVAGPVGRNASAATDWKLDAAVYSYSRSKGAFIGVALNGVVITLDDSANTAVYGMKGSDVLRQGNVEPAPVTMPFLMAVRQYTPPRVK